MLQCMMYKEKAAKPLGRFKAKSEKSLKKTQQVASLGNRKLQLDSFLLLHVFQSN